MKANSHLVAPTQQALTGFFGSLPEDASHEGGFWRYRSIDQDGIALDFSFNIFERSIQVKLAREGRELICISQEGAIDLRISEDADASFLTCECKSKDTRTTVQLHVSPSIKITWWTLLDEF